MNLEEETKRLIEGGEKTINPGFNNPKKAKEIAEYQIKKELIAENILKEEEPLEILPSKEEQEEKLQKSKIILQMVYDEITKILKEYCDLKEEYYPLVTTWIIGTYVYEAFETYPYLFINAMKGSGKTRLLKLIANLSHNGDLLGSMKEAVLFRTARGKTLCIDEFEGINRKENAPLRELLNACYKKGMKIQRMKRVKKQWGDEQVIEEFEPYTPICMANIYGMEEVLGDRCITMILERSSRKDIMKIMEDFSQNLMIQKVKVDLNIIISVVMSFFRDRGYILDWNNYVKSIYINTRTLTSQTTQTTQTTLHKQQSSYNLLFKQIDETNLDGRNLELFFPLFLISSFLDNGSFENMLNIAKDMTKDKKENEMTESRDVSFLDFVSQMGLQRDFIYIKDLARNFKEYAGDDEAEEERWINAKWVGRALKRLNLIIDKKRMADGRMLRIDIDKAIEKLKGLQ